MRAVAALAAAALLCGCQPDLRGEARTGGATADTRPVIERYARGDAPPAPAFNETAVLGSYLRSGQGIVEAPALDAYLNGILQKLLASWPAARPGMKVYVSTDVRYAAESAVGGGIWITRGTLDRAQSEDEIAFILAHEAAHVLLDHQHDRGGTQKTKDDVARLVSVGASIAIQVASDRRKASVTEDALRTVAITAIVDGVADSLLFPSWSRDQEERADALGMDLLLRAGYSRNGAKAVFDQLAAQDRDRDAETARVTAEADARTHRQIADANAQGINLGGTFAALVGRAMHDLQTGLTAAAATHGAAEGRDEKVIDYARQFYGQMPGAPVDEASLQAVLADPSTARILAAQDNARKAFLVVDTDPAAAQSLTRDALAADGRSPYVLMVASEVDRARGDAAAADAKLKDAAAQRHTPFFVYQRLLSNAARRGDNAGGLALIDEANRRYGSQPALMPTQIALTKRLNRQPEVRRLLLACEFEGTPAIAKQCLEASRTGTFQ